MYIFVVHCEIYKIAQIVDVWDVSHQQRIRPEPTPYAQGRPGVHPDTRFFMEGLPEIIINEQQAHSEMMMQNQQQQNANAEQSLQAIKEMGQTAIDSTRAPSDRTFKGVKPVITAVN